jgi:ribonuclease HII
MGKRDMRGILVRWQSHSLRQLPPDRDPVDSAAQADLTNPSVFRQPYWLESGSPELLLWRQEDCRTFRGFVCAPSEVPYQLEVSVKVTVSTGSFDVGSDFNRMKRTWIDDGSIEVGLDEAGRGPLWGRLYTAAVIMAPDDDAYFDGGVVLRQITDSKKLTPRRRAVLRDYIEETAVAKAVTWAEPTEIDAVNVLQADMNAMHRALNVIWKEEGMPIQRILVDGDTWRPWRAPESGEIVPAVTIPGGDAAVLAIAAASILAKEAHDEWVRTTVAAEPLLSERYGMDRNMGYGTAAHMAGLKTWGAHTLHRRSFAPVRAVVAPESAAPVKGPLFRHMKSGGGSAASGST